MCTTLDEVERLVEKLGRSKDCKDKALVEVLTTTVLPKLVETEQARKRAEEKAAKLEAMPRKRSTRIQDVQVSSRPPVGGSWPARWLGPCWQSEGRAL